jgi:hypothetical protein
MRIATASGLNINTGLTAPITRGLRETLNRLTGKNLYIVPPAETYWVTILSNPEKPNIWAGKGPSFDSTDCRPMDTPKHFWCVLDNGYKKTYKNDDYRAVEMSLDSNVEMTQTFEQCSSKKAPIQKPKGGGVTQFNGRLQSMIVEGDHRKYSARGRNDSYKDRHRTKLSTFCIVPLRGTRTEAEWKSLGLHNR